MSLDCLPGHVQRVQEQHGRRLKVKALGTLELLEAAKLLEMPAPASERQLWDLARLCAKYQVRTNLDGEAFWDRLKTEPRP